MNQFDFVFYVPLSEVKSNAKLQVILQEAAGLEREVSFSDIKDILEDRKSETLVFLDGLDEYDININKDIWDILKGWYLKHITFLVSSRPEVITDQLVHNFDRLIKIKGFNEKSRKDMCFKFLKDKDVVSQFEKSLQKSAGSKHSKESLHALSFYEMMLSILLVLFLKNKSLPETKTKLLQEAHNLPHVYDRLLRQL